MIPQNKRRNKMNDDMFGKLVVSYMTDLHNGVLEEDQVLNLIKDAYDLKMTGSIDNQQDTKNLFREELHRATFNKKGGLKQ
tara:strand:- start:1745 stop:1987 length:243 start_codon:yes stop_codon:yes gene_type:complete